MQHNPMIDAIQRNRSHADKGVYSVCSAHPDVLDASIAYSVDNNLPICIETTSNQVNQFGGYTGMTPSLFSSWIRQKTQMMGLPQDCLWLGGDHLGPFPWRNEPAGQAMNKAMEMVRSYVDAGYTKIHLDTSIACSDDPEGPLNELVIAERTAQMASVAEKAYDRSGSQGPKPLYIVGTEVPVPGGIQGEEEEALHITRPDEATSTLSVVKKAFFKHGLEDAWRRVIGLVVQPGVEFGDASVHKYDPEKSRKLVTALDQYPGIVFEAHSTDYQNGKALRALVENHFAILKVGPWFTFVLREALFSLSYIEDELTTQGKITEKSGFRDRIFTEVFSDSSYWKDYYSGNQESIRESLFFSLSDRIRYYWNNPIIKATVAKLIGNLENSSVPSTLVSQFFPDLSEIELVDFQPMTLVKARIQRVNRLYSQACGL